MGWEIHITRGNDWSDNGKHPITADEWLALVEADPELAIDPRDNGPYMALWLPHWVRADPPWSDDHPCFDWFKGCMSTTRPDRETFAKALEIVRALRAKVQDDDGQVYDSVPE